MTSYVSSPLHPIRHCLQTLFGPYDPDAPVEGVVFNDSNVPTDASGAKAAGWLYLIDHKDLVLNRSGQEVDPAELQILERDFQKYMSGRKNFIGLLPSQLRWYHWNAAREKKTGRFYFNLDIRGAIEFMKAFEPEVLDVLADSLSGMKVAATGKRMVEFADTLILVFPAEAEALFLDTTIDWISRHPGLTRDYVTPVTGQLVDRDGKPIPGVAFGEHKMGVSFHGLRQSPICIGIGYAMGQHMLPPSSWRQVEEHIAERFREYDVDPERPWFHTGGAERFPHIAKHIANALDNQGTLAIRQDRKGRLFLPRKAVCSA